MTPEQVLRIKKIAEATRGLLEKQGHTPSCSCHKWSDELVTALKSVGIEAEKVTVNVYYDPFYWKGKKRDDDAWNPHQVVMVEDLLVDISGDQFNGHDPDGFVNIVDPSRVIPPVNVIPWSIASGGKRPVYGYPEE